LAAITPAETVQRSQRASRRKLKDCAAARVAVGARAAVKSCSIEIPVAGLNQVKRSGGLVKAVQCGEHTLRSNFVDRSTTVGGIAVARTPAPCSRSVKVSVAGLDQTRGGAPTG